MAVDLPIVLGTARTGRRTVHVADYAHRVLADRDDATTELHDVRDLPFGNLLEREWKMDPRPDDVARFVEAMDRADGFVLVFPEYNHGYPGALKNVIDHLYDEWLQKPFGLVSTGGVSGGIRAQEQMRTVVNALGVPVPGGVVVPGVGDAFDEDGPTEDEARWYDRFDGFYDRMVRYARLLRDLREE